MDGVRDNVVVIKDFVPSGKSSPHLKYGKIGKVTRPSGYEDQLDDTGGGGIVAGSEFRDESIQVDFSLGGSRPMTRLEARAAAAERGEFESDHIKQVVIHRDDFCNLAIFGTSGWEVGDLVIVPFACTHCYDGEPKLPAGMLGRVQWIYREDYEWYYVLMSSGQWCHMSSSFRGWQGHFAKCLDGKRLTSEVMNKPSSTGMVAATMASMATVFKRGEGAGEAQDFAQGLRELVSAEGNVFTGTIFSRLRVQPYGVLGDQMTQAKHIRRSGSVPSANMVIVDPTGLESLSRPPTDADGASRQIYKWLGITGDSGFPEPVTAALKEPLDIKFHAYGEKNCIHAVSPMFAGSSVGAWSVDDAKDALAKLYKSIFREFAASRSSCLRLLPLSGGISAGPFAEDHANMTAEAVHRALRELNLDEKIALLEDEFGDGRTLEMCIFMEGDFLAYESAFAKLSAACSEQVKLDQEVVEWSPRGRGLSHVFQGGM